MQMNKNNLEEGILSKEGLTFWLDTVGKADVPKFYISRGVEGQDERLFMFNSADSLKTTLSCLKTRTTCWKVLLPIRKQSSVQLL